ncbi:hypothetical protein RI129_010425 [Pyrocoelia pectoralis]|uniref:Cytochrome P450 n=1 Tax=Pyrocoelia pectoralis TaxID=417401 RepID=A0AAN7V7Y6_9COLE
MLALLIIGGLCVLGYFALIAPFRYWTNRGVLQLSVAKLWFENLKAIVQLNPVADGLIKLYELFPESRYSGMYQITNPILVIKDPELIKQITVKDFDHFIDHNQFMTEECEPLWGKNLFSLRGERWKEMRATLSPSFTSSKMKAMFGMMAECAEKFVNHFKSDNLEIATVEFKDIFTRFANDVIASASFGINCDSIKDRDNEFYLMGKMATNLSGFWKNLSIFIMMMSPKLAKYLGVRVFSEKASAFFRNLVIGNMEAREKNGIVRPDMIHLLMEARKGKLKHERSSEVIDSGFAIIEESEIGKQEAGQKLQLTDDDVTAQALIFFFAGFDTVATLMCFAAYELAVDPFVQERLQQEVDNVLREGNGILAYEALMKMEYLDMVISETLRKWPAAVGFDRLCVKPYTIQPERNNEKPVNLKKGDVVMMITYGMHLDEKYFPNPDRFDPERFNKENRKNITPYTYMPFGIGPRSCIGNRFALLETKILIFNILKHFDIVVVDKSVVPIKLARKQMILNAEKGFWFGLKPRKVVS